MALQSFQQDSLCCGKATAVETVHRTVSKSRLSSPFWLSPSYSFQSFGSWTRFAAAKPRRLRQSTGLSPRAGFRVHFGSLRLDSVQSLCFLSFLNRLKMVGQNGLEPSTSRLSVVCSSQLSYWPILPSSLQGTSFAAPSKLNNVKF